MEDVEQDAGTRRDTERGRYGADGRRGAGTHKGRPYQIPFPGGQTVLLSWDGPFNLWWDRLFPG